MVETLLAASLFMLLTGAAIISLEPASRGRDLDQGAVRLESILRFARAEAANTGRRVRVAFTQEAGQTAAQPNQVHVLWEPQPLDSPEVFQDLSCAKWELEGFSDSVNVEQVRMIDSNTTPAPNENADATTAAEEETKAATDVETSPITFNPDGSSDSAEIVLAARNSEDSRRITVRVIGLTGVISREVTCTAKGDGDTDGHGRTQETGPLLAE